MRRFKSKLWNHRGVCHIEQVAHLHGVDAKMAIGAIGAYGISQILKRLVDKAPETPAPDARTGMAGTEIVRPRRRP